MRFRDFIKIQSKECSNAKLKSVWADLYEKFDVYKNVQESKKIFENVLKSKKEDDIDNKRLWILHFYNSNELKEKGLTDKDNVQTGFKSLISDDIIGDNGDEYVYIGKSPEHKFYLLDDVYYVRAIGGTSLNRVTEFNYKCFSDYIEYLDYK